MGVCGIFVTAQLGGLNMMMFIQDLACGPDIDARWLFMLVLLHHFRGCRVSHFVVVPRFVYSTFCYQTIEPVLVF